MKLSFRHRPTYRLYQETKTKAINLITVALFAASIASSSLPLLFTNTAAASDADTVTVTPAAMNNWEISNLGAAQVNFVEKTGAPLGNGAAELVTTSSNDDAPHLTLPTDMRLNDITKLSFEAYKKAGFNAAVGATMRLSINLDGTGSAVDDQLMYESYFNGPNPVLNTWQTQNVLSGKFWSNYGVSYNGLGGANPGYPTNFTISNVLHDHPNAKVVAVVFSLGTWNPSTDVLVDKLELNDTTYDFEPVQITPCSTINSVVTTDLNTWDLSETRATGHNQIVSGGLHVWNESNTSTDKAAGYYAASFKLADLGAGFGVTTSSGSGVLPSLQLKVDLDGNGTAEGYLVGEPASYGANTLWLSSNWTGIDLSNAPTAFNGGGTGKGGTVNAWLSAFPNAKVYAIGYSLGSGVHGDYTISKIAAGCTDYTFNALPPTAPQNLVFSRSNTSTTVGQMHDGDSTNNKPSNTGLDYIWGHWDNDPAVDYQITTYFKESNGTWTVLHNSSPIKPTPYRFYGFGDRGEGVYRFRVAAYNPTTHLTSPYTNATLIYDHTAPSVPTNLSWKTNTNLVIPDNGVTKVYDGIASWQGTGDVDHYIYKYWNDITGNPYKVGSEYTANVSGTSLPGVFNQGEGVHHFCVVAVDAAGNQSACSAPFTITYDKTAPSVPVITAPTTGQHFNSTPILNKWNSSTDNLSGIDRYQVAYRYDDGHTFGGSTCAGVQIGGQDLSGCRDTTGTSRNHVPALSEQGGVTIWVRAYDKAGNVSDWSAPVHYFYDATAPSVPAALLFDNNDNGVADNGYITTQNFHFNLSSSPDVTRYQLKYWNDIPGSPFSGESNAWSPTDLTAAGHMGVLGTYTDLFTQGEGTHYFAFSACDTAGNCSAFSAPFTVTYDATAPSTPVASPAAGTYTSNQSVTLSSTDNSGNAPKIYYTTDGSTPSSSNGTLYTGPISVTSNMTIKAIAYDDASNASGIMTAAYVIHHTSSFISSVNNNTTNTRNSTNVRITNTSNQNARTGNANVSNNTNGGNGTTGDAGNTNQGVLGAATDNGVEGASTNNSTVNFANADHRSGQFLGLGWWWLLILAVPLTFWWLIAAKRRRKDEEEKA